MRIYASSGNPLYDGVTIYWNLPDQFNREQIRKVVEDMMVASGAAEINVSFEDECHACKKFLAGKICQNRACDYFKYDQRNAICD